MNDEIRPQGSSHPEDGLPRDAREREDMAFAKRIAEPLQAAERLDVTFEARVMSAIHAETRAGSFTPRSWWLRPMTIRVSPVAGLAAAAALAGIVLLGALVTRPQGPFARAGQPAPDTIHVVRFMLLDPAAQSVSLVGSFNAWTKGALPLARTEQGVWSVSISLPSGRHEYAFIVQDAAGERWVADPFGAPVRDEFDTESSVVVLGPATSERAGPGAT
jgi:hypothetical protein